MESSKIWFYSFYSYPITEIFTHNFSYSFPESEGDTLLIEVQDKKKSVQGKAVIHITSFTDNPVNISFGVHPELISFNLFKNMLYCFVKLDILKSTLHLFRMKMLDGGQ